MEASDQTRILARLQELVGIHGKRWGIISEIMEKEGFREKGNTLSSNALRKRFKKLSGAEQHEESEQFEGGGSELVAELVALNKQLLNQIQESNRLMQRLEKRLEEQEQKTSHTGGDTEQPVSSRDLLELLREITSRREEPIVSSFLYRFKEGWPDSA